MAGSIREKAIFYVGGRHVVATVAGGSTIVPAAAHALDGPSHTGDLPIERISTDETDTTLVARPDGAGGLEFSEETVVAASAGNQTTPVQSVLLPARVQPTGSGLLTEAGDRITLFDDSHWRSAGQLAELDGVIHHVYQYTPEAGTSNILYAKSYDRGFTWTDEETIATAASGRIAGQACIGSLRRGRLVVAWGDSSIADPYDVYARSIYSDDGGATWSAPYDIPADALAGEQCPSGHPLELPNGDVILPSFGDRGTDGEYITAVYISHDGGATWPDEVVVADQVGTRVFAEIQAAWVDGEVVAFMRCDTNEHTWRTTSSDYGLTWSTPTDVLVMSSEPDFCEVWPGVLVMSGREDNSAPFSRRWSVSWDKGLTWETPVAVDSGEDSIKAGYTAFLTLSPGNVLMLYAQRFDPNAIIYIRHYVDGFGMDVYGNVIAASGTGTVTSVAQTVPAEFSVAGSPITTSGTLAISKATQSPNTVWAGPTSGSAAVPTFRALVAADIPAGTDSSGGDHEHVIDVFNGDGSTVDFELSDEPLDPEQVFAFVAGSWTAVTMSGAMNTTATFGSAPGAGTGNVVIQYPAAVA